ncbi:DUF1240 domain-containing protein [Pectobacterium parmentieri]|uniref:DUF1240 domain-containing protein n=1 Tax=Pectobacterium parmentieri TaxID=1905730 RepID=UPI001373A542|nr:DUF1240 domain-containing protein [Pectobacterium parmentieri]QHQ18576.1 DUF1240 domain-containing protein [Pectobacterium parmentieri]
MVKINRPFLFIYSVFIFILSCCGGWFSLSGYLNFFSLNDVILFSWKLGVIFFLVPIVFQFSYFGFFSAIRNRPIKMNGKLSSVLVAIFVFGAIVSFALSIYISYGLNDKGYMTCPKNSWMDPNKHVREITLCKE